jgi:uncharacterized membrane protein YdfJ with MMPL/SSD domain
MKKLGSFFRNLLVSVVSFIVIIILAIISFYIIMLVVFPPLLFLSNIHVDQRAKEVKQKDQPTPDKP